MPESVAYPLLARPGSIGRMRLRNRIVMAPCTTNFATSAGVVTEAMVAYYAARAAGGAGLVIVEGAVVDPPGRGAPRELMIDSDAAVPGLSRLAAAIRRGGAMPALQLIHCGRQTRPALSGCQPVAPSPVPCPGFREQPRELSPAEIENIRDAFVAAAGRAAAAGFEAVELHAAHGYLLSSFLSPFSNFRTDGWGGDTERRTRLVREIIAGIHARLGADFPVVVRFSGEEFVPGGVGPSEAARIAVLLERAGAAAVHVSAGVGAAYYRTSMPAGSPPGEYGWIAGAVRRAVRIPVIAVGRITTQDVGEAILAAGQADFIAVGRALIADPDWPSKALGGRAEAILPCVGCNVCNGRSYRPETRCLVNPFAGREGGWTPAPANRPLRVAVIGSSVAGLEAARIAARRGHRVEVLDASERAGGLLAARAGAPLQGELRGAIAWWLARLDELDVPVRCARGEDVVARAADFDVALLACTEPAPAESPDQPLPLHVPVIAASELLLSGPPSWRRAAVLGGSLLAAEAAHRLAVTGCRTTLVAPEARVPVDASTTVRHHLLDHLRAAGVRLLTGERAASWPDGELDGVVVSDHVRRVPTALAKELRARVPRVEEIGDAYEPEQLTDCVERAAEIALRL